ncbi:MAG: hypothetical protein IPH35_14075 [Rhodoferax sp.]|nr:hypothetical protein [Rhodoferax sp.]
MKTHIAKLSVFTLLFISFSAFGEEILDLEEYLGPTKETIRQIRSEWHSYLTPSQLKIEEETSFSVRMSWNSNGYSSRNCRTNENRKITITAGQMFMLNMLSENQMWLLAGQSEQCFTAYLDHVSDVFSQNSKAVAYNNQLTPMFTPMLFAHRYHGTCKQFSQLPMPQSQWSSLQESFIKASLRMLLSHELGHQVNNHGCKKLTNSESREQEAKADSFAVNLIIKQDPADILGAFALFTFWSVDGAMTSSDEFGNTHPAGLRRLRSALDAVSHELNKGKSSKFYNYLIKNDKLVYFKELVDMLHKKTEALD